MLTEDQIQFFNENGFLRLPQLYRKDEIDELSDEMDRLVQDWSYTNPGWTGPWRQAYMNPETEKESKLTSMHDLHLYSAAWMRGVTNPKLAQCIADLIGPDVELHHSTMHIKPPQTGHPFPMHQDHPFYAHQDDRFIDALVHLDDTFHENGEIRFLAGSHKLGPLKHIIETADGPCSPHLPTDAYRLEDTTPVPAQRGDVVLFNYLTIHGSYINQTRQPRRMVRVGYRNPHNNQLEGQSAGRPGVIVWGYRERRGEEPLLKQV